MGPEAQAGARDTNTGNEDNSQSFDYTSHQTHPFPVMVLSRPCHLCIDHTTSSVECICC